MIEVIHFQNRFGKSMVCVIQPDDTLMMATPIGKDYALRYAAGLEKPFYPVPVVYDPIYEMPPRARVFVYVIRFILGWPDGQH